MTTIKIVPSIHKPIPFLSCLCGCQQAGARHRSGRLFENLLHLTDIFPDFAGGLFGVAFVLQILIADEFPGNFPGLAFCFVKLAFRLIPDMRFHGCHLSGHAVGTLASVSCPMFKSQRTCQREDAHIEMLSGLF